MRNWLSKRDFKASKTSSIKEVFVSSHHWQIYSENLASQLKNALIVINAFLRQVWRVHAPCVRPKRYEETSNEVKRCSEMIKRCQNKIYSRRNNWAILVTRAKRDGTIARIQIVKDMSSLSRERQSEEIHFSELRRSRKLTFSGRRPQASRRISNKCFPSWICLGPKRRHS